MNIKSLVAQALAAESKAVASGLSKGVIYAADARGALYSRARAKTGAAGQPDKPDRITLAVSAETLLSVAGDPKKARQRVVVVIIPEEMALEIEERSESLIIRP